MDNDKMDGLSMDIEAAEQDKLHSLFPQCFIDGRLDERRLLAALGRFNPIDENDRERYEFRWNGKQEAQQLAGKRSAGTLRPYPEESVDWDTTQNIYIEGDNLEVLKILQTAYYRKIKMIYIDPPYNTGNDFVYEDDFADPLARYREITQQTTKSNPEAMGRFHTNWLNMMYPRMRLAANLLRDDGVIFISIDENELTNLRKLCDEIFGEEHFVSCIACVNKPSGRSDDKYIATAHESILVYRKTEMLSLGGFEPDDNIIRRYSKTDKDGQKYREEDLRKRGSHDERAERPNLFYPFFYNPKTEDLVIGNNEDSTPEDYIRIEPMKAPNVGGTWRWGKETASEHIAYLHPRYMPNKEQWSVFEWEYLSERDSIKPTSVWDFKDVNSERGSEAFIKVLGFEKSVFQNPKPVGTIERIVRIATNAMENDIILDFFSGSATTAQAIMQLNAEDGGNRRFIMVQLPELCDDKSDAYKAGFKNLCEVGKERIRRAGTMIFEQGVEKWSMEQTGQIGLPETIDADGMIESGTSTSYSINRSVYGKEDLKLDTGFRVFKLDSSNLKLWDDSPITGENALAELEARIYGMLDIIKPDRTNLDVVYEVMLKLGQQLTEPILPIDLGNGKTVYGVGVDVKFIVCLAYGITPEDAAVMAEYAPGRIVFADSCFDNSEQKSNVRLTLKDKGISIKAL